MIPSKHLGTKRLETNHLVLRRFTLQDAIPMLKNWIADPEVQHRYCEPVYRTEFEVLCLLEAWMKRYQNPDFYRWAILLRETGMPIGQIAFCRVYPEECTAEVEYCIGRRFWGQGYTAEALKRIISFAFCDAGFHRLEAFHTEDNPASGQVMQKAGMRRTDMILRFQQGGIPAGRICYALTADDFPCSHQT